ncbi:MAG: DUF4224 domain-containing protein [Pseudomonadota bacterium]
MSPMFLDREEVAALTGRKNKGRQFHALRKMGIPFFVKACGHPVVTRVAIEGRTEVADPKPSWTPPELPTRRQS